MLSYLPERRNTSIVANCRTTNYYAKEASANAAFIAAARNLLTPENLSLLVAALAPQWVSVTEGLPEGGKRVLLQGSKGGTQCIGFLKLSNVKGGYAWDCGVQFRSMAEVTHWMPLPAAPATMEGSQPNA